MEWWHVAGAGAGGTILLTAKAQSDMIQGVETPAYATPNCFISIIIKNLNEEDRVGRCIESLLNQNVVVEHPDNFEILLVDGGSTDRSVEIARKYPIKVIVADRNGILHQKNIGIMNASGEILVFVDSDSYYSPYWLSKIINAFEDDVVLVHTSIMYDDIGNFIGAFLAMMKNIVSFSVGAATAVRRIVFEETGLFDESYDCVFLKRVSFEEEWELARRALLIGRVVYQQNNPVITTGRRFNITDLRHECVRNPKCTDCRFAQDVGVTRF